MGDDTVILIPVKKLEESKTSFSEVLPQKRREELTLAMLEDVLNVGSQVKGAEAAVVTPDEEVINFVGSRGFKTISEPDVGLNRALEVAIGEIVDSGFEEILILPADVPLLKPHDIQKIFDLVSGDRSMVITPSKENGTNALLLRPPDVMDLHFGGESFPEHVEEARSRGIKFRIYRSENLERDIDKPEDLLKVETLGKGTKTHSFLSMLK